MEGLFLLGDFPPPSQGSGSSIALVIKTKLAPLHGVKLDSNGLGGESVGERDPCGKYTHPPTPPSPLTCAPLGCHLVRLRGAASAPHWAGRDDGERPGEGRAAAWCAGEVVGRKLSKQGEMKEKRIKVAAGERGGV